MTLGSQSSGSKRLILASGSPRRALLLSTAGFVFDTMSPNIDESMYDGEQPGEFVLRLAEEKVKTVVVGSNDVTLGADTSVVVDGTTLGKPSDSHVALEMLTSLSGRSHSVLTGWFAASASRTRFGIEETIVTFNTRSETELLDYIERTEPFDKAGAYAIQGDRGWLIQAVSGSRSNVMGLPIREVVDALGDLGVERSAANR